MPKKLNPEIILKLSNYDWLYEQYINLNLSGTEISENLNIDPRTVCKSLAKFNIKKNKEKKEECRLKRIQATNLQKYGVKTTLLNKETWEKRKHTMIEKYGSEHALQSKELRKKAEETCFKNYGVIVPAKSESVKEKIKQTNLERYGAVSPIENEEIAKKIKKTNLEKYGTECSLGSEEIRKKSEKTNLERYGVKRALDNKEIQQKARKTLLKNYGVSNPTKSKKVYAKIKQTNLKKYGVDNVIKSPAIRLKGHETKKRNKSYNKSNEENFIYSILKTMFSDIIRQYNSEKYPFDCDFYLPEIDLYIEYQGSWTHGKKPFDGKNIPSKWLKKCNTSSYYKAAIKNYTETDPLKRKIAEKNNLKYLEIWRKDYEKGAQWILSLIKKYQD